MNSWYVNGLYWGASPSGTIPGAAAMAQPIAGMTNVASDVRAARAFVRHHAVLAAPQGPVADHLHLEPEVNDERARQRLDVDPAAAAAPAGRGRRCPRGR